MEPENCLRSSFFLFLLWIRRFEEEVRFGERRRLASDHMHVSKISQSLKLCILSVVFFFPLLGERFCKKKLALEEGLEAHRATCAIAKDIEKAMSTPVSNILLKKRKKQA